jgi:hypothetical protein
MARPLTDPPPSLRYKHHEARRSGTARIPDQSASGGTRRCILEREFHVKRITLVASALCFALGAFSAFAEDKMDKMGKMDKTDKMEKSDKMGKHDRMAKKDKMAKHDKMDKMEKPGAMQ